MVYPPVPLGIARVADVERMQMLVESASRAGAAAIAARLAAAAARAAPSATRRSSGCCAGRSTSIRWRSRPPRNPCLRPLPRAGEAAASGIGEQQDRPHQLLDRLGQIGRRLERIDLGQQLVGVFQVVGIDMLIEQRQRLERRLRRQLHRAGKELEGGGDAGDPGEDGGAHRIVGLAASSTSNTQGSNQRRWPIARLELGMATLDQRVQRRRVVAARAAAGRRHR